MCDNPCRNELNLDKLCVRKLKLDCLCAECLKANKLRAEDIKSNTICTQTLSAKSLFAENETANNICVSGSLNVSSLGALSANTNNLCAQQATFGSACINNLTVGSFTPITKYRATVNFSADTVYTLGAFLNFNNIVDDPNNNISSNPTTYTAPISGYYTLSYKVNIENLTPNSGQILGSPIANPSIFVNGILVREAYSPFLTFNNEQKVIIDSLITLQAGDKVTMKYDVLTLDPVSGLIKVNGTVNIVGSGIEDGNSLFKIILLSSLGNGSTTPCQPCPQVTIPCSSATTPCDPFTIDCSQRQMNAGPSDCESCQ